MNRIEPSGGNSPKDLARYIDEFGKLVDAFIGMAGITMGNNPPTRNQLIAIQFNKECYEISRGLYEGLIARCHPVSPLGRETMEWHIRQWSSNVEHLDWYLNKHSHLMEWRNK